MDWPVTSHSPTMESPTTAAWNTMEETGAEQTLAGQSAPAPAMIMLEQVSSIVNLL